MSISTPSSRAEQEAALVARTSLLIRTIGFLAVGYLLAGLVAPGPRTSGHSPNEHMPATH